MKKIEENETEGADTMGYEGKEIILSNSSGKRYDAIENTKTLKIWAYL